MAPRANVALHPKGDDDWDAATNDAYNAQIQALKDAPAGELSEENRAVAHGLLDGLDWVSPSGADVVLSSQSSWPTYAGDFAADCVEPIVLNDTDIIDLENQESIIQNASLYYGKDDG